MVEDAALGTVTLAQRARSIVWEIYEAGIDLSQSQQDRVAEIILAALTTSQSESAWKCRGHISTPDNPGECDWPYCGCDAVANKVIEHFYECGLELVVATPSPTPYVRPAAEIRAEIERQANSYGAGTFGGSYPYFQGYIAGLTFALAPPTQEPR